MDFVLLVCIQQIEIILKTTKLWKQELTTEKTATYIVA